MSLLFLCFCFLFSWRGWFGGGPGGARPFTDAIQPNTVHYKRISTNIRETIQSKGRPCDDAMRSVWCVCEYGRPVRPARPYPFFSIPPRLCNQTMDKDRMISPYDESSKCIIDFYRSQRAKRLPMLPKHTQLQNKTLPTQVTMANVS